MAVTEAESPYSDLELLGEGGMGQVLRATDTRLQRKVALKALRSELAGDDTEVRRFLSEARCTGQLEHPGIPPIYELSTDENGRPYFSMKLIEGETMGKIIEKLQAGDATYLAIYSFERRLQIGIDICDALSFAHSRGWLHCDIKPDNIMIGKYGEVYLNDWGISKPIGAPVDGSDQHDSLGTPGFCPPEQVSASHEMDERSDIFALGATLYEFFTLRAAFPGPNLSAVITALLDQREVPMADSQSDPHQGRVPREIAYVLKRALQKDRDLRFPNATALRQELQKVVDGVFPAVCLCTATKRSLGLLQDFVDSNRGIASALIIFWFFAPIMLAVIMWYILPR